MWVNLTVPVEGVWVRTKAYYKYTSWHKMADFWTNICGWLSGKDKAFNLDWLKPLLVYSNFNQSCPWSGNMTFIANNISAQPFAFPQIVPSGRYRIELDLTENVQGPSAFDMIIYGSVSDHRIEVV